jgi:hypothetical protein
MDIPKFPVSCHFMIEDANNGKDAETGAGFTMISTKGVASTYALQATVASPSATQTGTSESGTTDGSSTTGTASLSGGEGTSNPTGSSAAQTAVAASAPGSLSPGAKGGLAIGIIIAVVAVLAGIFFYFRRTRRQMQRLDSTAKASMSEKAAAAAAASGAHQANPQGNAQEPGAETLVAPSFQPQANNRNSEDWRRFFGNAGARREPAAS